MTASNQEVILLALETENSVTGLTYGGHWHKLWNDQGIAAGTFNERMLTWLNGKLAASHESLPAAMHAFAVDAGFNNWISMATIDVTAA